MFSVLGEAIQIRFPSASSVFATARVSLTIWLVVALSVVEDFPYGGSVTMQSTCVRGGLCACARFTMHLASLEFIADGWKKGFLRGLRSTKGFGWISASFMPKTSLWLVRMPKKVLSGFLRLTFAFVFWRMCS